MYSPRNSLNFYIKIVFSTFLVVVDFLKINIQNKQWEFKNESLYPICKETGKHGGSHKTNASGPCPLLTSFGCKSPWRRTDAIDPVLGQWAGSHTPEFCAEFGGSKAFLEFDFPVIVLAV